MAWNPPPNWPAPPTPGWSPPAGWQPDPAWGPPPEGWVFWPDGPPPVGAMGAPIGRPQQRRSTVPPPHMSRIRTGAGVMIAGGLLAVFGAFGTWIRVTGPLGNSLTSGGMTHGHDGPFVLVLGLLALGYGVARFTSTRVPAWLAWLAIVDGALLALVAIADTIDVHNKAQDVHELAPVLTGHVGWGLIVSVIAAFVIMGGAAACIDLRRTPVQMWQPPMPPPPYAS
jgi:hypothetical protein